MSYHLVRPQNLPERRNVFREMFSVITEAQSPLASRSMAVVILNKFFVLYWNHFVKLTGLFHCVKVIFVSHKHKEGVCSYVTRKSRWGKRLELVLFQWWCQTSHGRFNSRIDACKFKGDHATHT